MAAVILLCSGGLDSLAAWRLLACNAVRFDIGTLSSPREREAATRFGSQHGLALRHAHTLLLDDEMPNGYNPHRNLLLLLAAARIDPHVAVAQVAEWAPDKNPRIYRRLQRVMRQSMHGALAGVNQDAKIEAPFARTTKAQLLRRYAAAFGRPALSDLLRGSWSCYAGGDTHCGACLGCASRYHAETRADARYTTYTQTPAAVHGANTRDALRWLRDGSRIGLARRALEG